MRPRKNFLLKYPDSVVVNLGCGLVRGQVPMKQDVTISLVEGLPAFILE